MRLQFVGSAVRMNLHIIIFNMYTGGSEYRIIEGTESIEVLRVHFGGTVAAHQVVFEEDADFGYDGLSVGVAVGGYFDAGVPVCARHRGPCPRNPWAGRIDKCRYGTQISEVREHVSATARR